jgi:hypothetical protein
MTEPAAAAAELTGIADAIRRFHEAALAGLRQEADGAAAWRHGTMALASVLRQGRLLHRNDNVQFGLWLKANGLSDDFISKDDRAALIGMAEHPEIAIAVLETTAKRSWRTIWLDEIVSKVEEAGGFRRAAKTPSGKQEPGCPRQTTRPAAAETPAEPETRVHGDYARVHMTADPPTPDEAVALAVQEVTGKLDRKCAEKIGRLEFKHAGQIEALKAAHAEEIGQLNFQHEGRIQWIERAYDEKIEELKRQHEGEIEAIKVDHGMALAKSFDDGRLAGVEEAKRELGEDIEQLTKALHEAVVAKLADKLIASGQTNPTEQEVAAAALGRWPEAAKLGAK